MTLRQRQLTRSQQTMRAAAALAIVVARHQYEAAIGTCNDSRIAEARFALDEAEATFRAFVG